MTIKPEILHRLDQCTKDDWIQILKEEKLVDIAKSFNVSISTISKYLDSYLHLPTVENLVLDKFYFEGVPIATTEGAWMDSKERKSFLQYKNQINKI